MSIKLTPQQRDEIRKLTQRANRRIKGLQKQYEKEGISVLPVEFARDKQTRKQWETKSSPISRTTKFSNQKELQQRLNYLRSFDNTATNYSRAQQSNILKTVKENVEFIDADIARKITNKLENLNAAQLSKFWQDFEEKSRRMGAAYDSKQALAQHIAEFAGYELEHILGVKE